VIPLGDVNRPPVVPIAVYALIVVNIYVFVQELGAPNLEAFINSFATIPYDVTHDIQLPPPSPPTWLTLVTAQFLHGGWLHIISNMVFLFAFGPDIEYLCGHVRLVAFYLLAGIVGNLAQIVADPGNHVPAIGASGALAGVMGAFIVRFPTHSIRTIIPIGFFPLFVRLPAVLVIGIWALTQFLHGFGAISTKVLSEQGGGVAYFAHIGGFTAGALLIGFFSIRRAARRNYRYYY